MSDSKKAEKQQERVQCQEPCPIVKTEIASVVKAVDTLRARSDERHAETKQRLEWGNMMLAKIEPMGVKLDMGLANVNVRIDGVKDRLDNIQYWSRSSAMAAITAVLAAAALFIFDVWKHNAWDKPESKAGKQVVFKLPLPVMESLSQISTGDIDFEPTRKAR